jgi:hypothetical protein
MSTKPNVVSDRTMRVATVIPIEISRGIQDLKRIGRPGSESRSSVNVSIDVIIFLCIKKDN